MLQECKLTIIMLSEHPINIILKMLCLLMKVVGMFPVCWALILTYAQASCPPPKKSYSDVEWWWAQVKDVAGSV